MLPFKAVNYVVEETSIKCKAKVKITLFISLAKYIRTRCVLKIFFFCQHYLKTIIIEAAFELLQMLTLFLPVFPMTPFQTFRIRVT